MNIALILFTAGFFGQSLKAAERDLDFNAVKHYQIPIEEGIYGLHTEGNTVFTFPGEQAFYIRSLYKPEAQEKDLGFGSLHNPYGDSERLPFEPKDQGRRIRGALQIGPRWAFLDVMSRQFVVYNEEAKVWLQPTDIILDTARPPRDARGEATRAEASALHAKVTKELSRERKNPDLLAGVTQMPKKWKDHDGSQFLLWVRGGTSPLLTLKCELKDFKSCVVQRACRIKGLSMKDYPNITSIARDPKTDTVLILLASEQRLLRIDGNSCHGLTIKPALRLPKNLPFTQTAFVDEEQNLWLGLKMPEASTSGSLFVWDSKSW